MGVINVSLKEDTKIITTKRTFPVADEASWTSLFNWLHRELAALPGCAQSCAFSYECLKSPLRPFCWPLQGAKQANEQNKTGQTTAETELSS